MSVDFQKLLSKKVEDVKRPPTMPVGTYVAIIGKHSFDTSKQKGTPFVSFEIKAMSPEQDVDQEMLAKFRADGGEIGAKPLKLDFYLTPDAEYRLKEFLEGPCDIGTSGRDFAECIPQTMGKTIKVHVSHTLNTKDPAAPPYANIDSAARA